MNGLFYYKLLRQKDTDKELDDVMKIINATDNPDLSGTEFKNELMTPGAYPEEVPVVEDDRMSRSEVMSMFKAMDDRMGNRMGAMEANQAHPRQMKEKATCGTAGAPGAPLRLSSRIHSSYSGIFGVTFDVGSFTKISR